MFSRTKGYLWNIFTRRKRSNREPSNWRKFVGCINNGWHYLDYYSDQAEARRLKSKMSRQRREERQAAKRAELLKQYAKEDEAADAAK